MSTVIKDLGAVSAYAYAVEKGYTGTEAEFAELMADYAEVGQRAEDAAESALNSKTAAQTAATTATNKASEATTAAQTATTKAAEAQADADAAALDASQALSAASTATTKATEATTAAATATSAATTATTAKDDAVSAKTAAQTAQGGAESARDAVQSSAAQITTNAEDITQLKEGFNQLSYVDITDSLTTYDDAWIRYSNGERVGSSKTRLFTFPSDNIKSIHAFLTSDTNVLCAIAFYTTTTISTDGYMQNASIDFAGGTDDDGLWYSASVPVNCKLVAITSKVPSDSVADYIIKFDIGYLQEDIDDLASNVSNNTSAIQSINTEIDSLASKNEVISGIFAGRFKPCYDHLFVNKTGDSVVIPHESLYHVRISAKLGFNCIEANIAETSDGVYIVNHLNSGKFGGYFHHVDGTTDISNVAVSSVTWDWITENVRYNSTIPKYRTRPCTLPEFLGECKQQNLIPFATATSSNMIKAIESIMGKNNYIAYGATRENAPDAIIYHWISNLTTKEAILEYCESVGTPFIYGMGNAASFTDEQLSDIVTSLHANGFMIGTSYDDTRWHKYQKMGFDFNGAQYLCNRIEDGNICNLESIFNYNDFIISNGTETDGVISFAIDGSIIPNISDTTITLGAIDLEIEFSGSIQVQTRTLFGNYTITSAEKMQYVISAPILNNHPKMTIVCYEGSTIYDIKFKATKC